MKYQDIELGWLGDSVDSRRTIPVATIWIHHVKLGMKV